MHREKLVLGFLNFHTDGELMFSFNIELTGEVIATDSLGFAQCLCVPAA